MRIVGLAIVCHARLRPVLFINLAPLSLPCFLYEMLLRLFMKGVFLGRQEAVGFMAPWSYCGS